MMIQPSSLSTAAELEEEIQTSLFLAEDIIDRFGARLTGSKNCRESAKYLKHIFQKLVPLATTSIQKFDVHPASFLSFTKLAPISFLIAIIFWQFNGVFPYISTGIITLGAVMAFSQFFFYKHYFDKFHKKKQGFNVVSTLEPMEEVKRQIIVSGHHDSAFEFRFLASKWQKWYGIRIIMAIIPMLSFLALAWVYSLGRFFLPQIDVVMHYSRIIGLICLLLVLPLYGFLSKDGTPGAGDNLIASTISLIIARKFGKAHDNYSRLRNTRLIAVSFDSEEAGLRGSFNFAQQNKDQLLSVPTYHLNIDSIYNKDELHVLTRDINGFLKLSKEMALGIKKTAEELGYSMDLFPMTFGGGGTDAAELARIGIAGATTIIGMSTEVIREGLVYHTKKDTIEQIEPEAVEAVIKIATKYIENLDKQQ